jgi:hypothetical protein
MWAHPIALAIFESHIRIRNTVCYQCGGSGSEGSVSYWPLSDPDPYQKMSRIHKINAFLRRLLRERSRDAGPSHRAGLLWPARLSPRGGSDRRGAHHACAQAWHHRRPPANHGSAPGEILSQLRYCTLKDYS